MQSRLTPSVSQHLRLGPVASADLQILFGVSQPAMSRILSALQEQGTVIAIGKARATKYAAPRPVQGLIAIPVMAVNPTGGIELKGTLTSIYPNSFVFSDPFGDQAVYESLPWFIQDMKTQGFLGRAFPNANADLNLPPRIGDWTEDHHFVALARRGEDCVGNLLIGDESLQRYLQKLPDTTDSTRCSRAYSKLAALAIAGTPAGSSAGGEQPKFAANLVGANSRQRPVLVKFTQGTETLFDLRWKDLLLSEHIALTTLRSADLAVPRSRLLHDRNRLFLEVERFDRTSRGRVGVASAMSIDSEFVGSSLTRWSDCALALVAQRKLSHQDLWRVLLLETFGNLIGNTDMHFGNLSFFRHGSAAKPEFELAPVYDQLPMFYAPVAGELPKRDFGNSLKTPRVEALQVLPQALSLAKTFWRSVAEEPGISASFKAIAAENLAGVGVMDRLVPDEGPESTG